MYATTAVSPEAGTMYLTTSSGYPYVYHNGVAYFHTSEVSPVQQPWPVSNLFWYICFSGEQDSCSVFKSLLLPVSSAMPHTRCLNGFLLLDCFCGLVFFKYHFSLFCFCRGLLLWCDLLNRIVHNQSGPWPRSKFYYL